MLCDGRFIPDRLLTLGVSTALLSLLAAACTDDPHPQGDLDVSARSSVNGIVNGEAVEGSIAATFNTGRGGSSTCTFTKLPQGFSPATFGTHT